jgi:hypothetical protein
MWRLLYSGPASSPARSFTPKTTGLAVKKKSRRGTDIQPAGARAWPLFAERPSERPSDAIEDRLRLDNNRLGCGNMHRRRNFLRLTLLHLDGLVQVMDRAGLRVILAMFGFSAKHHNADHQRTNQRRETGPPTG